MFPFSGLSDALDVQFDDASSGFFLRDISMTSLASSSSQSASTVSSTNDDVDDDDVMGDVKTKPTTSIVLGETKDDASSTTSKTSKSLADVLHSSR